MRTKNEGEGQVSVFLYLSDGKVGYFSIVSPSFQSGFKFVGVIIIK